MAGTEPMSREKLAGFEKNLPEITGDKWQMVEHCFEVSADFYTVRDRQNDRLCLGKFLSGNDEVYPSQFHQSRVRFQREKDTLKLVENSPWIVSVVDFAETVDGRPGIIMKFYPGKSLESYREKIRHKPEIVAQIAIQVCLALHELHGHGLVHRDIKPGNIMIHESSNSDDGYVATLIDFGLANNENFI